MMEKFKIQNLKLKTAFSLFFIFYFLFFIFISPVLAQGILPACVTDKGGICGLNDFLVLGVNISELILKYVGVLALVFFIVGGIMWLTSAGNPERVKKGKTILVNSLIGLLIVFFAWQIVNLVVCAVSEGTIQKSCQIFDQPWFKFPGATK